MLRKRDKERDNDARAEDTRQYLRRRTVEQEKNCSMSRHWRQRVA